MWVMLCSNLNHCAALFATSAKKKKKKMLSFLGSSHCHWVKVSQQQKQSSTTDPESIAAPALPSVSVCCFLYFWSLST